MTGTPKGLNGWQLVLLWVLAQSVVHTKAFQQPTPLLPFGVGVATARVHPSLRRESFERTDGRLVSPARSHGVAVLETVNGGDDGTERCFLQHAGLFAGVASAVAWVALSVVALRYHPDPKFIDCSTKHNILTMSQAFAFPLPVLISAVGAAYNNNNQQDAGTTRRLQLGLAATFAYAFASSVWAPAFACGYDLYSSSLKAVTGTVFALASLLHLAAWKRNNACSCNWTSYFRGDEEKVPSVEKYKDDFSSNPQKDSHSNPKTLEELTAFGETLHTGDILIMHCTHDFGKLAQLGTMSPWDHVGMVIKCAPQDEAARNKLVAEKPPTPSHVMPWPKPAVERTEVLEAMGGGVFSYPFTTHAICRGNTFKYIAVRRLRNKAGEPLSEEQQRKVEAFVQEFWGRPYEQGNAGYMELARPVLRMRNPNVHQKRDKSLEQLDHVFCSELITEALQRAEILPEETLNSNEILPSMFAPGQAVDKYLEVAEHGYRLGEVEVYKAPKTPLNTAILKKREEAHKDEQLPEGPNDPNPGHVHDGDECCEHEKEELKPMPKIDFSEMKGSQETIDC